jgi:small-conductance mechanosensitive channel
MPPHAIDFEGGLSDAWTSIATFVPKLLFFLIILVIGWLIAKALEKVVNGILERVGFDRAVERGGVKQALAQSKYDASDILAKLVYYFVLLFTLVLAFNVFGPNAISDLLRQVIEFLPSVFVAIVIVVVAAAIAKAVKDLVSNVLSGLSYGNVLANIASIFILFLGVIAALNQVGVATTVTTPVLITILATIGGVIVVGAGGGLIKPMQARWEGWLSSAERESGNIREQVRASGGVKEQGRQMAGQYRDSGESSTSTGGGTHAAETTQMDVPPESRR